VTGFHDTRIGDLAASIRNALVGGPFGSDLTSRDYVTTGVPVIRGANLGHGRWVAGDFVHVTEAKADSLAANCARPGDLIFTQRGTLGQVALVPDDGPTRYLISQSQMKLTVNPDRVDARYLYYASMSVQMKEYIRNTAIQAGVPHINLGILRAAPVPLPPLDVQNAIAATLGSLDDKIESNLRLITRFEELGATLLESVVQTDVYGFPKYEEGVRLGDKLSVIESGSRPKGGVAVSAHGIVSLGAESIQSAGTTTTLAFKRVPSSFVDSMRRGRLEDGDVLVYKDGGRPGNFIPHVSAFGQGFPVAQATINEHVYRVRSSDDITQGLLYWILRSRWMDQEMRKRGTGVAIPGLNSTNFRSLPWPVLDDRQTESLNEHLEPMLLSMLRLGAENVGLAKLRVTLLPELLAGRLRATREDP
jgi:type I restriction enzyme S subunit